VNHDLLIKMVRETVKDEAIITLIKKFLKSGVISLSGMRMIATSTSKADEPPSG
jgi:retron-type reverse transcriptase